MQLAQNETLLRLSLRNSTFYFFYFILSMTHREAPPSGENPFSILADEPYTAHCIYDDLVYAVTHTREEWQTFLNHSSELYDAEFRKMMRFLEDHGKPKYEAIKLRQQIEIQVVKHYKITDYGSDLLSLMSEEEKEEHYNLVYEKDPENSKAMKYRIKQLTKQLVDLSVKLQTLRNEYDRLETDTASTIEFQNKVIRKLKSMNKKLKFIDDIKEWRNNERK